MCPGKLAKTRIKWFTVSSKIHLIRSSYCSLSIPCRTMPASFNWDIFETECRAPKNVAPLSRGGEGAKRGEGRGVHPYVNNIRMCRG